MNTLIAIASFVDAGYNPPSGGQAPPGVEFVNTVIQWLMWGGSAVLFAIFVLGLVQAGNSRNQGGQANTAAPIWPLLCAIGLAAAPTIWVLIG